MSVFGCVHACVHACMGGWGGRVAWGRGGVGVWGVGVRV